MPLDPLTAEIRVRLQRPTAHWPFRWYAQETLRVHIIVTLDGTEYRCTGQFSGGRRTDFAGRDIAISSLTYRLPTGLFGEQGPTAYRLGERGRARYTVAIELELVRGSPWTEIEVGSLLAPAPAWPIHQSVAFDIGGVAIEETGDGVVSFTHTASGNNRGVFAGVFVSHEGDVTTSTSCTYGGVGMTEQWDVRRLVSGTFDLVNAGYTLVNPSLGAKTVTSTVSHAPSAHIVGVISMTGVNQLRPVGPAPTPGQGTSQTATVTVTEVGPEDLVVSHHASFWNGITAGADETVVWNLQPATPDKTSAGAYQFGTAGGVMSATRAAAGFTDDWIHGAIAFKPSVPQYDYRLFPKSKLRYQT